MKKIRVVIVDDNDKDIKLLEERLKPFKNIEVLRRYNNPEMFLNEEQEFDYDALLLDVEMPSKSGLEVAKQVYKPIAFITGRGSVYHDNLADFKLENKNIIATIAKPISELRAKQLVDLLVQSSKPKERIMFNTGDGKVPVKIALIELISSQDIEHNRESQGEGKIIYRRDEEPLAVNNCTLENCLLQLPDNFIQISKFDIINTDIITGPIRHDNITVTITGKGAKKITQERTINPKGKAKLKEVI